MRHWIATLLAIFVALQFSWAAVAAYDQHEPLLDGSTHFGHHFAADSEADTDKSPVADHGHCHLVTAAAAMPLNASAGALLCPDQAPPDYRTPLRLGGTEPEIERPKWQRA